MSKYEKKHRNRLILLGVGSNMPEKRSYHITFTMATRYLTLPLNKTWPDPNREQSRTLKLNIAQMAELACENVESIVETGQNAGDQHFLLFR